MPHDFSDEIQVAFDRYEAERDARVELPPLRFVGGPYFPARVKKGDILQCARLGEMRVVGWSDGPLPWPKGVRGRGGPPSLILFADLEKAVRVESAVAVALAWGVSRNSVRDWRAALGVGPITQGTAARHKQNKPAICAGIDYEAISRICHTPEKTEKARLTRLANGHKKRQWSAEEVAWMGQLSDAEIAERLGCNKLTVARERNRRGIAGRFTGCSADLPPVDPSKIRARRLALGLTQQEVGARMGKAKDRVIQLEAAISKRAKPETLEHLAQALECEKRDLQPDW